MVSPEESIMGTWQGYNTGETAPEPHQFYGYYTLHTIRDGQIVGMRIAIAGRYGATTGTENTFQPDLSGDHARDQENGDENH